MVVWIDKRFCLGLKGSSGLCSFFFLFDQRSHVGWSCGGLILTSLIPFFLMTLIVPGCLLGREGYLLFVGGDLYCVVYYRRDRERIIIAKSGVCLGVVCFSFSLSRP